MKIAIYSWSYFFKSFNYFLANSAQEIYFSKENVTVQFFAIVQMIASKAPQIKNSRGKKKLLKFQKEN